MIEKGKHEDLLILDFRQTGLVKKLSHFQGS